MLALYFLAGAIAIVFGIPVLYGSDYSAGIIPCLLLFGGFVIQLIGAIATNTTRQLGRVGMESLASVVTAIIYAAMLTRAVGAFGLNGPGLALMPSMAVGVLMIHLYFRSTTERVMAAR